MLGLGCSCAPRCSVAPLGLQTNSRGDLVLHKSLIEMWWGEGNGMLLKENKTKAKKKKKTKKTPLPLVSLPLRSFESILQGWLGEETHTLFFAYPGGLVFVCGRKDWWPGFSSIH